MSAEVQKQFYFLFLAWTWGMGMCWVYDGLRLFRQVIPHSRRMLNVEDLFYWLCMTALLFYLLFTRHRGEIRSYIIFGVLGGSLFYFKTISPVYLAVVGFLLRPLKILFSKIRRFLRKMKPKSEDKH